MCHKTEIASSSNSGQKNHKELPNRITNNGDMVDAYYKDGKTLKIHKQRRDVMLSVSE